MKKETIWPLLFFVLLLAVGSVAFGSGHGCGDCCDESACTDCQVCNCCPSHPVALPPAISGVFLPRESKSLELANLTLPAGATQRLLEPPPR